MKVFGLDRQLILSGEQPSLPPSQKDILMRPDSAVSNSGKHLYTLPHLGRLYAYPVFVYKVAKVGKFASKKFCHKYLKELTLGISLCSKEEAVQAIRRGDDPTPYIGFDSALVVDNFLETSSTEGRDFCFQITSHGTDTDSKTILQPPSIELLYDWIEYLSSLYMLKMGDLLCYPVSYLLKQVEKDDDIYVSLDENELAYIGIR